MSIYEIVVKARFNTEVELRNIHHYEFPSYIPTTAQLQEAVDGLGQDYRTDLQAVYANDISFYAYDVRRVDTPNLPAVEFLDGFGVWAGTGAADPLPTQIAALTTFKAQTIFPRSTRTYHFPMTESNLDSAAEVVTSTVTALNLWGSHIVTLLITAAADATKVAVKYTGTPRSVTQWNQVTQWSTSNIFATQRRRRKGVGI